MMPDTKSTLKNKRARAFAMIALILLSMLPVRNITMPATMRSAAGIAAGGIAVRDTQAIFATSAVRVSWDVCDFRAIIGDAVAAS